MDVVQIKNGLSGHGLVFNRCVNSVISNVTFYNPGGFFIYEELASNSTYAGNRMYPWPGMIGSTYPLLSGSADGIHSVGAAVGPSITGNYIANNGDDGIAIHGACSYAC